MRKAIFLSLMLITSCSVFAQQVDNKRKVKQEANKTEPHLKLYPLEATTYVNIYVDYPQPTDFVITILASPLNNERKWELRAKTSHQQSLDVTQLPNGTYTITLVGGGVSEKAEFTVKR